MAFARRVLALLIAAAVALAPVGAASAAHAPQANPQQAHTTHHTSMHHDHGAMQAATATDHGTAHHCKGASARTCCCDDETACAQTCLQKCFGQIAVLPPERTTRQTVALSFSTALVERPPGWSSAPQLPPPRA